MARFGLGSIEPQEGMASLQALMSSEVGQLALVKTLDELDELLGRLDGSVPFPEAGNGPRGRQGSPARVALPEGWLSEPDDCSVPEGADVMHSGG